MAGEALKERAARPNKRMQLTTLRAAPVRRAEVPPCAPAGGMDGGTASQLIRGVRRTSLEQRGRAVQVGARLGLLIGTMLAAGPSAGGEADLAVRKAEDQCWQDAERLSGQTNLRKMFEDDGDRRIPRRVHGVDPVFPEAVRRPACLRLLHEVLVDSAGRVVKVVIVRRGKPEVACPEFEKAALEAIIHWTYEPYVVSRRAMPFCLTIGTNIDIRAR